MVVGSAPRSKPIHTYNTHIVASVEWEMILTTVAIITRRNSYEMCVWMFMNIRMHSDIFCSCLYQSKIKKHSILSVWMCSERHSQVEWRRRDEKMCWSHINNENGVLPNFKVKVCELSRHCQFSLQFNLSSRLLMLTPQLFKSQSRTRPRLMLICWTAKRMSCLARSHVQIHSHTHTHTWAKRIQREWKNLNHG